MNLQHVTCPNCGHGNKMQEAPGGGGSYFSDCARDESGHCLPGGSAKQPGAPGGGSRLKQGLKIGAGIAAGAGVAAAGYKFGKRAVAQQRWKKAVRGLRAEPGGSARPPNPRIGRGYRPGYLSANTGPRGAILGSSFSGTARDIKSPYFRKIYQKQGPDSGSYGLSKRRKRARSPEGWAT